MRTCPRCGYVDPKQRAAARRHDAKRSGTRAAYMREYRRRKKAEAGRAAAAKKARSR